MAMSSLSRSSGAGICAHAAPGAGFKRCCLRSGRYDGAQRTYYFPAEGIGEQRDAIPTAWPDSQQDQTPARSLHLGSYRSRMPGLSRFAEGVAHGSNWGNSTTQGVGLRAHGKTMWVLFPGTATTGGPFALGVGNIRP